MHFDVDEFLTKLDAAIGDGEQAEAEQERAKANVSREEGGVVYELRILLPEAEEHQARLLPFGVTKEFVGEGRSWQAKLDTERDETTAAKAARKALTRRVRASEMTLSALLRQLEAADETVALERPEAKRWFPLSVINAERGRVNAAREARIAARAAEDPGPDTKDE